MLRTEQATANIYGTLFEDFDDRFFEKVSALFAKRHERWGMDLNWFRGKVCLDAGCGSGRYVVALARLGASRVYGIDLSPQAIAKARERIERRALANAEV